MSLMLKRMKFVLRKMYALCILKYYQNIRIPDKMLETPGGQNENAA